MRTSIPYADVEPGRRRPLRWVDRWSLLALALALAVALPVLVVLASLLAAAPATSGRISPETVLWRLRRQHRAAGSSGSGSA